MFKGNEANKEQLLWSQKNSLKTPQSPLSSIRNIEQAPAHLPSHTRTPHPTEEPLLTHSHPTERSRGLCSHTPHLLQINNVSPLLSTQANSD